MDQNLLLEEKCSKKYRHWLILLYEDTNSYDFKEVLRIIKAQKKYAFIKHIPESNEKKEHFHCIISLENPTLKSSLSKKLGVPSNFISEVKNLRAICRYLIHIDDDDKIQYSLDQVKVSKLFEKDFNKQFDDLETEEEIIDHIYSFIDSLKGFDYRENLRNLILFVNIHCYDTIYKRFRFEFLDYLKVNSV